MWWDHSHRDMSAALDSDQSGPWCGNQRGTSELDCPRVNGLPDLTELFPIVQSEINMTISLVNFLVENVNNLLWKKFKSLLLDGQSPIFFKY